LTEEPWPEPATIRVRRRIHTGEASERDGDYFGPTVNGTARLRAVAHRGQIVCSQSTATLTDPEATPLRSLAEQRLRDLVAPEIVTRRTNRRGARTRDDRS
jgi:class 3 adenylate cyclase